MKTEPADNEDVKCEVGSGFIKCEQEVACKEDPDLLTVKTEPVESVHIKSLSDCGTIKTEPVEFSLLLDNSDTPASSPPQIGELFCFTDCSKIFGCFLFSFLGFKITQIISM